MRWEILPQLPFSQDIKTRHIVDEILVPAAFYSLSDDGLAHVNAAARVFHLEWRAASPQSDITHAVLSYSDQLRKCLVVAACKESLNRLICIPI